jgi:hypothetical protein
METIKRYENYPIGIVLLSNFVSLAIYVLGLLIMFRLWWAISSLYLIYVFILEYRILKKHCTNCFYYGKTCGFGKGRMSAWFFKRGDISKFCIKDMTWRDMLPDILVSAVPLVIGIILLILKFDLLILGALLLLLLLVTMGNGYIRQSLTCRYCKQRELGCPADVLFNPPSRSA